MLQFEIPRAEPRSRPAAPDGSNSETKLVASFYVGSRDSEAAMMFIDDLAPRLAFRVQLTSDGHSTSHVERQNLNIRMGNRRMTRLTNAFSKKAANHAHMMAI